MARSIKELMTPINDLYIYIDARYIMTGLGKYLNTRDIEKLQFDSYTDFSKAEKILYKQLGNVIEALSNVGVVDIINRLSVFELDITKEIT